MRLGLAVPARLEQAHGKVFSRSRKRGIEFKRSLEKALGAVEVPRADQRSSERVQDQRVIGQDAQSRSELGDRFVEVALLGQCDAPSCSAARPQPGLAQSTEATERASEQTARSSRRCRTAAGSQFLGAGPSADPPLAAAAG